MEVELKAEPREEAGKGIARRLRTAGRVPGVLYGPELGSKPLSVDGKELWRALHTDAGINVLINLILDGDDYLAMPREVQRDIVRGTLQHVDFLRIRRDVAIQVDVPVHLEGESKGVKEGGVIEHHLWELRVECLPGKVPESIEADITELMIGDSLQVSALKIPDDVTLLTPEEETVVSVVPPPVLEIPEVEVPEEEEGAELAEGEEAPEGAEAPEEGGEAEPGAEGEEQG
jgi:large subunit ribosomal protein L25